MGWWQGSTYRTKNTKCRSFPPALPLHTYTRVFAHNMITDDVCSLPAVSTNHIFWCIHMRFHKSYLLLVTWPNIAFTYSAPWSTYAFVPALKLPGNSAGAGSITCEFTLTCEPKTHCTWDNTMKVNPRNVARFLRCAFSWKKQECWSGRPRVK